jgi:arylsulfatase A-like enzyme
MKSRPLPLLFGFPAIATLLFSVASLESAPSQFANTQATPSPHLIVPNRHVVIVVWDGMRPDFISAQYTPTLAKLAREGVTFRHHHSVYPTATDVNGAAIATGVYPARNGLLANREYRPGIDPEQAFENADPDIIRKGDEATGGNYLAVATVAEIVRAAGGRTAIVGTKSVAFLSDRHAEWTSAATKNSITRFAAAPMPPTVREEALNLLGPFLTEQSNTSEQRNAYATCALTDILWRNGLPEFSLLWLSDPDLTQHEYSPGAPPSIAAIKNSDRNLTAVLETLKKKNARNQTDLFVISDHGFSTIERGIDFPAALCAAGFDAVAAFQQAPQPGQVMVVENGGTILFYIVGHDQAIATKLVEWLQHSSFAGVIFSHEKFEGCFPLDSVRADTPDAPDVMVSLRWRYSPNHFGIPGQIVTDATRKTGQGSHATLSEFDVHNILIASGPDLRSGFVSNLPSGNVDLAPTVLQILGLKATHEFDGRVLSEAMTKGSAPLVVIETLKAGRKFSDGQWQQHLKVSRVGETTYIDEGNGAFEAQ